MNKNLNNLYNCSIIQKHNKKLLPLSKFLAEKHNKKLWSFDSYLFSVISDLVKEENTIVSNEVLWNTICSLPGTEIANRPLSYNTEDFGIISRTRVTNTCEDKFGDVKGNDGQKRFLVFNNTKIQKLKTKYSPIEEIKIIDNATTNTSNTFNTFWKGVERKESHKDKQEIDNTTENMKDQEADIGSERENTSTSLFYFL